jgi:tetratricopeptide (TPR) repeat protein
VVVSHLSVPDCPDEHSAPHWNDSVAAALCQAYALIAADNPSAAAACLHPFIAKSMSHLQRIRVLYVLSLDAANRDLLREAFDFIEEALNLAVEIGDLDACAILANQGASILHNMQHFVDAAAYFDISLDALCSQENLDPVDRAPREFDLLVSLAIEHFYRTEFEKADDFLAAAWRLPLTDTNHDLRKARAAWTAALLARWRGWRDRALQYALAAHEIYTVHGAPIERARMRLALADVYLDMAAPPGIVPPLAEYGRIVELAERPLMDAIVATDVSSDLAGKGLALLTYARYLRVAGRDENALSILSAAEAIGRQLADLPLLGQVQTSLGAELMAQGEISQAHACYRSALEILHQSDVSVQAIWPQRALWHDEEMRA